MMGGRSSTPKRRAYQYTISTNSWANMAYDATLYTNTYNCGAAIIHMKGNGHRYLVISSNSGYSYPSYFDLTSNSGWKRLTYGPTGNHGRLVSVTPSEAYMVGCPSIIPSTAARSAATPARTRGPTGTGTSGTRR